MDTKMDTYQEWIQGICPLDPLFFSGHEAVSKMIKKFQNILLGSGEFSHLGLVITSEVFPHLSFLEKGRLYVWESTMSKSLMGATDGVPSVETGKGVFGVQIRDLETVAKEYTKMGGKVAWAPLIDNPWKALPTEKDADIEKRRSEIIHQMEKMHEKYGMHTYDANCVNLIASLFPCCRPVRSIIENVVETTNHVLRLNDKKNPNEWVFCSEFVGIIYQGLNIIGQEFNMKDLVPMDILGYDKDGIPALVNQKPTYFYIPETKPAST